MENVCIHCYISGRVHGVFFRASSKEEAEKLGLKGWVKNLPDGRVELVACGSKDAIEKFSAWLKHGPDRAHVVDCHIKIIPMQHHEEFEVIA